MASAEPAVAETDPVGDFFNTLSMFLGELSRSFPECSATKSWISRLQFLRTNDKNEELEQTMRDWYDGSVAIIRPCINKDPKPLLEAPITLLQAIDFKTKWMDPDLDEASHGALWEFINTLNYLATIHFETSPEKLPEIMKAAVDLQKQFGVNMDAQTGQITFNIRQVQAMMSGDGSQLASLLGSVQGIMPLAQQMMGGGAGAPSGMDQFLKSAMGDMGAVYPPQKQ